MAATEITFKTTDERDAGWRRMDELVRKRNLTLEERAEKQALTAADLAWLKSIGYSYC